jgi:site-specific recombinase XerD
VPAQACVTTYHGKRDTTYYVKFKDADGRQVKERVGTARGGWTKNKAKKVLRERLVAVEREGYRKPTRETFSSFAASWVDAYPRARRLKRSTSRGYEVIVDRHLRPVFGALRLTDVTLERINAFVAAQSSRYAPGSVNRQLNVLSLVLRHAQEQRLISFNPMPFVTRPREQLREWRILTPDEAVAVEREFDELIDTASLAKRDDLVVVRRLFLTHMGIGIRRAEAAGLKWRSVFLTDPEGAYLRVSETFVRSQIDSPKSRAGLRTIDLGPRLASELFDHRLWSTFRGDDEFVFANPRTGRPFDAGTYGTLVHLALDRAGITDYLRPSHDLRHSSITNAARAGTSPEALMSRSGHSSYATTRRYINLAGARFRDEAQLLEERLWGSFGTKAGYQTGQDRASLTERSVPDPHE